MNYPYLRKLLLCSFCVSLLGCATTPRQDPWYRPAVGGNSSVMTFENDSPFFSIGVWYYLDGQSCNDFLRMPFGGRDPTQLEPNRSFKTSVTTEKTFTFRLFAFRPVTNPSLSGLVCSGVYSADLQSGYDYNVNVAAHGNQCDVNLTKINKVQGPSSAAPETSLRERVPSGKLLGGSDCKPESNSKK